MTGQPRSIEDVMAEYTADLESANATYHANVAEIKATPERRVAPLERGILATYHRVNDGYVVRAGRGETHVADRSQALLMWFAHNETVLHPEDARHLRAQHIEPAVTGDDRRES